MTYILSPKRGEHFTAEELAAHFQSINRPTGRKLGGLFTEVERVGHDENVLELFPKGDEYLRASGTKGYRVWITIRRSADALHKKVRRLRDADAAAIATVDAEIADLQRQIRERRALRATIVRRAWAKGQQVPLREIVDLAPTVRPSKGIGAALAEGS